LENKGQSYYTSPVRHTDGSSVASTSKDIHNHYFISANHLYSASRFNSNPGSKNVIGNTVSNSSNKVVMINFDDGHKSQFIYAKPILDKYGFMASFFIICGRVGTEPSSMNWQDIAELKKDGMDIESHSMTHINLNKLSTNH
jgi:peptidoglycan/xylan/chitin deacetylase (PgdA/CDA1 family)